MLKSHPLYTNFAFLNGDFSSFEENNDEVFVLMPFGNGEEQKRICDDIYYQIRETIEENCFGGGILNCSRADLENGFIIMSDICTKIKKAGLTIFDISYPNNNVYFELGLACALDKKILLTYNEDYYYSYSDEKLPFDISQFRYLPYSSLDQLRINLKKKVEELIAVDDFREIDVDKVYKKVQKIARHLNVDSKADQIREDYRITDYEVQKTNAVLDKYFDDPNYQNKDYNEINYLELESEIRSELKTQNRNRVKAILWYLYWQGAYQPLIANLGNADFVDCKSDYEKKIKQQENES